MELHNSIIRKVEELAGSSTPRRCPYDPQGAWEDTGSFELVMLRDAAYELGGSSKPAVNFTCVTTSAQLVEQDEILVFGPDLTELRGDSAYALHRSAAGGGHRVRRRGRHGAGLPGHPGHGLREIPCVPQGYMIRTSSESNREQVRLSSAALKKGISFRAVGNDFIRQYRQNPNILAVKLIFITAPDADYAALKQEAKTVRDITMSLSKILEGMPTDCGSCNLKPICDEVEGMRSCTSARRSTQRNNALLGQSGHPERGCPLFRCMERSEYYLQIHGRLAIMGYKRTSLII
ncbi:MAG: hypothetical protein ACLR5H_10960 [Oscillospiraceae bacterium]